jgi:hypothetical protein
MSESTHMPTSVKVKARPSLQSLTDSEGRTAASSHADIGSWYLPNDLRGEWNLGLTLDRHNEKQMVPVGKDVKGKPELPMHFIPASRLRKTQKQRSCTDMLWNAMVSAGRAIASCFQTPVGAGLPVSR